MSSILIWRFSVAQLVEQRIIKLHLNGSIAQRIEQQPSTLWVDGLNPSGVTIGPVAQLVEQYTFNVWVSGSNPDGITITKGYIKLRQTRALESNWDVERVVDRCYHIK